ncbi:MAG TPA: hypothetical protein ENI67_02720, partial [Gammaproteobacteria bacterium]|nr:hypothetical protein [Gammaproteobacteria bacterium]
MSLSDNNPAANVLMFFKQLLTTWFLLFTLGSSVTWAFSDHPAAEHDAQVSDSSDMWSPSFSGNNSCDDHCGHSSAHVVALIPTSAVLEPETDSAVF